MTNQNGATPFSPGIQVPAAGQGTPACVRIESADPAVLCHVGVICSRGTATPSDSATLEGVIARIYRTEAEAQSAGSPPDPNTDPNAREGSRNGNNWEFNEIPSAQCENSPGSNADNWLVVWAKWSNNVTEKETRQFYGQCADHTDCEQG